LAKNQTKPEPWFSLRGLKPDQTMVCQVVNRWDPQTEPNQTNEQSTSGLGFCQETDLAIYRHHVIISAHKFT